MFIFFFFCVVGSTVTVAIAFHSEEKKSRANGKRSGVKHLHARKDVANTIVHQPLVIKKIRPGYLNVRDDKSSNTPTTARRMFFFGISQRSIESDFVSVINRRRKLWAKNPQSEKDTSDADVEVRRYNSAGLDLNRKIWRKLFSLENEIRQIVYARRHCREFVSLPPPTYRLSLRMEMKPKLKGDIDVGHLNILTIFRCSSCTINFIRCIY